MWSQQAGCSGGWPPMPQGGAGGQLHRDFSSQTGRHGAERQSPEPAQHRTLWGVWRSHNRQQDPPEKESATCPCAQVMPGISHNPLLPLSRPCPPWPPGPAYRLGNTSVESPADIQAAGDGGDAGRGGLAGCPVPWGLGAGTRLRSPGPGQRRERVPALPEQQREMNNLGRPLSQHCHTT